MNYLHLKLKPMRKKIIRTLLGILTILFLLVAFFIIKDYAPDKPLSELKEKWTYDNSQFVKVDGLDVHYRINGSGHPLVLIHGTGASLHTWEPWTKILEKDFKVISLDMPAFGLTGPNETGVYTLENYAQFLNTFLEKVEVDSFHLGGNSLGGGISWKYATMFPEKVKKLILLDASGYPSDKEPPLAFKLANNPITSKILLTVTPKSLFVKSLKEVFHNDDLVTDEMVNRYYELYLRSGNRQAFVDRVKNHGKPNPFSIASIKNPTLLLWGADDLWVDPAHAARFDEDIPNSKLIMYENVGHLPMEEIPERSAMDVKSFLLQPDLGVFSEN